MKIFDDASQSWVDAPDGHLFIRNAEGSYDRARLSNGGDCSGTGAKRRSGI